MIRAETDGKNFVLLVDDVPVLCHSPSCPFLSVSEEEGIVNRFLGHLSLKSIAKYYHTLTEVSYDGSRSLLRFYHGSRSAAFSISEKDGALLLAPSKFSHKFGRIRFRFPATPGEPVFGCGGNINKPNLRGRHVTIWANGSNPDDRLNPMEILGKYPAIGQNSPSFALPTFFTGSLNYYMFWFGGASTFDFTHKDHHEAEFMGIPEKVVMGKASVLSELHKRQSELLGKRCSLPVWYQTGIIAGVSGGSDMLLSTVETFKKADIPISALYIRDWTGEHRTNSGNREFWDWIWNKEHYPHLDKVIQELSEFNISVLCYINPHLAMEGRLYAEAAKKGYLIKRADGTNLLSDMGGFMAGHIDLTNPEACLWAKQAICNNVFSLGFSGIITDMSDLLPDDSKLYSGADPSMVHNLWPALWTKLIRSAADSCGTDPVCIVNSGSLGSSASLISANGSRVDWMHGRGLESALNEMLSLGLSGAGPAHCDFSAYAHLIPEPFIADQLIRWAELTTFTPAMRTHTLPPSSPASFQANKDVLFQISRLAKLRFLLAPYISHCIEEFMLEGTPPMRHMWEAYPTLEHSEDISDQFMLGDELLVAPVIAAGQTSRQVVFPAYETWVHIFSGEEFESGSKKVDAPLGSPPVFYKKGGSHEAIFASLAYKTLYS
jgi:alpha-glucosidase